VNLTSEEARAAIAAFDGSLKGGPRPVRPSLDPAVRDRVLACEYRGCEGGLVLRDDERSCCGGGAERTACSAGKGAIPGRVTLRECLECVTVGATVQGFSNQS
jgi:hypothetical protein